MAREDREHMLSTHPKFSWGWPGWSWYIEQFLSKILQGFQAVIYCSTLFLGKWYLLLHPEQVRLCFKYLGLAGPFRAVKNAFRTSHSVRALVKKVIRAVAMAQV